MKYMLPLCAWGLVACLSLPAGAASFSDVPSDAWYAACVQKISEQGLMTGVGGGAFHPSEMVTRATVVTVLWRMEGSPVMEEPPGFSDVDPDAWYAVPIAWARMAGIASGNGQGFFQPEAGVTREQLGVFLHNYAKYKGTPVAEGVLEPYADAGSIHDWALAGMQHAVGAGLLKGDAAGRLNPTGTATRAELATVLDRMMTPAVG